MGNISPFKRALRTFVSYDWNIMYPAVFGLLWFTSIEWIQTKINGYPDSKVHGANMGPTWVLSAPEGLHVGPMNLAIRIDIYYVFHFQPCPSSKSFALSTHLSNTLLKLSLYQHITCVCSWPELKWVSTDIITCGTPTCFWLHNNIDIRSCIHAEWTMTRWRIVTWNFWKRESSHPWLLVSPPMLCVTDVIYRGHRGSHSHFIHSWNRYTCETSRHWYSSSYELVCVDKCLKC